MNSLIPGGRLKFVMSLIAMPSTIVVMWRAAPPAMLVALRYMSSGRAGVAISAPLIFATHFTLWLWIFMVISMKIRQILGKF